MGDDHHRDGNGTGSAPSGAGAHVPRPRRPPRSRPLVSWSAVRTWARREGLEVGGVFREVDPVVVDRYLAHLGIVPPAPDDGSERSDVSDERACELFLTLSSGADKLEPALRVEFYRALAAELQVPLSR